MLLAYHRRLPNDEWYSTKNTWMVSIFRLGLVQACLGAVVVLMTSTLNRLMVVELSMAATYQVFSRVALRRSAFKT